MLEKEQQSQSKERNAEIDDIDERASMKTKDIFILIQEEKELYSMLS